MRALLCRQPNRLEARENDAKRATDPVPRRPSPRSWKAGVQPIRTCIVRAVSQATDVRSLSHLVDPAFLWPWFALQKAKTFASASVRKLQHRGALRFCILI